MGQGKHYTSEKRDLIKKLILEGKTYTQIQNYIGCFLTMIRNGCKPAMSPKLIKRVVRYFKNNSFLPATQIKNELNVQATLETVRRRLREHNLAVHSPRKVPLLTKKHVARRMKFASI